MEVCNRLAWSVADVCAWAREMNYPQDLLDAFMFYRIDGPTLAEITEEDLEGIIKDDLLRKEIATHARYFRLQRTKYGFLIRNPGVVRPVEYSKNLAPIFPTILRGSKTPRKLTSPSATPRTKHSGFTCSAESSLKQSTQSSLNSPEKSSPKSRRQASAHLRRKTNLRESTDIEPMTTVAQNTIVSLDDEIHKLEQQSKLQEKVKETLERDLMARADIETKQQILFDRHLKQELNAMRDRYETEMDFVVETLSSAQEENQRLRDIIAKQEHALRQFQTAQREAAMKQKLSQFHGYQGSLCNTASKLVIV